MGEQLVFTTFTQQQLRNLLFWKEVGRSLSNTNKLLISLLFAREQ